MVSSVDSADSAIRVRAAEEADGPDILRLERELAEFERLDGPSLEEGERLLGWIFAEKRFQALVAEWHGTIAGTALYFFYPTSFRARLGLYLEDLVVSENARSAGVGRALMSELARIAERSECVRMEWAVLDWNEPAIQFYRKLGARPNEEWTIYRLTRDGIAQLAQESESK